MRLTRSCGRLVVVLALAAGVSGCGGGDAKDTDPKIQSPNARNLKQMKPGLGGGKQPAAGGVKSQ
jgi:hypothetical protein